jgi:ATP-dependent Zn protease
MAAIDAPRPATLAQGEASLELAKSWRKLTRAATVVAVLTAPALFVWFTHQNNWDWWVALLATLAIVIVFRGFSDLLFRRLIPWPSLFGLESQTLREEDVVGRRRAWFWRFWFKVVILFITVVTIVWLFRGGTWLGTVGFILDGIGTILSSPTLWVQAVFVFFLFFANFAILFGPLLLMNMSQMQSFEPGDAEWGVKLEDVRGQVEAKEEVRRVVDIWQSGEQFERAGGKRERGLLLFGAPGTGKTMLAKAIATGFNSPFISMPGSGFAATFIGIDAIIVRLLARRAKKLARKWGGQCIVFIDEIDAVGMRRQSLGTGGQGFIPLTNGANVEDFLFYGPGGSRDPSGDLNVETRAWRDRLFEQRAPVSYGVPSGMYARLGQFYNFMFPGGMGGMGGGLALNQLLVVMDGIDNPPWMRRTFTSKLNTMLDASFIVPRRIGNAKLRLPAARPRKDQIYFIGATNVPIDRLDPALIRPGRMGRHVWFRTPTKDDRLDILELYIGKVSHDPELDLPNRRDEIARIMSGYSPAMIEQATSMALTIAHHTGRTAFAWDDLVEAVTTLDAGTAIGSEYVPHERRAVAIHEAGHAVAGHVHMTSRESTRLTIKKRGDQGVGGHHWMIEKEERLFSFQHEMFQDIIWGLGAMAAERVVYGENSNGVGGDVAGVTARSAMMVGRAAMGPQPFAVTPREGETEEEAHRRVLDRFEKIGLQIMSRSGGGGPFDADPIAGVLGDPAKRTVAAQVIGQAYVTAHNLAILNRGAIERIADALEDKREIMGDELLDLLDSQGIRIPDIDYGDESAWPPLEFSAAIGRGGPGTAPAAPAVPTTPGSNGEPG